ncbi:MAG: hypothetical protein IT210_00840 [Armatimonadetes bacterium]|nr:hypothetical protein [Armatimonadota bacterium]
MQQNRKFYEAFKHTRDYEDDYTEEQLEALLGSIDRARESIQDVKKNIVDLYGQEGGYYKTIQSANVSLLKLHGWISSKIITLHNRSFRDDYRDRDNYRRPERTEDNMEAAPAESPDESASDRLSEEIEQS